MDALKPTLTYSRLTVGWVRHRRYQPKPHSLKYPVFMWYLDLDELPALANVSKLLSIESKNWLSFRRNDFFNAQKPGLKAAVIEKIANHADIDSTDIARVCLLTNLRTLGYIMNPVTFYYAFDKDDQLLAIMPEITNTPWNETHQYVLTSKQGSGSIEPVSTIRNRFRFKLPKSFYISPFHPMNIQYDWRFSEPTQKTNLIHLENWQEGKKIFDATLSITPQQISAKSVRQTLIRFPWMTVKVATGIYWNALKLWLKGVPFYAHPHKSNKEKTS